MTPQEHANAVWRAEASPESLAGAITAYTEEIRGELHRANEEVERLRVKFQSDGDRISHLQMQLTQALASNEKTTAENAALREEVARLTHQPKKSERCEYCDGTGDVHDLNGEWKGECDCVFAENRNQRADLTASRARCAELEVLLRTAVRLIDGKYISWQCAGGVNNCTHGYGEGVPCPKCDRAAIDAALSTQARKNEHL